MVVRQTRARLTPDANEAFYAVGQANITDGFYSTGLPVEHLTAYWNNSSDFGINLELRIVFEIGRLPGHYGEVYTFSVVSAVGTDLSVSTHTIETSAIATDVAGVYEFVVAREQFQQFSTGDNYFGLHATMADGYPVAYVAFSDVATAADEFTLTDDAFQRGSVTFNAHPLQDDQITVVDSASNSVVFTFGTSGGQVPLGVTASDAATNLATAINADGTLIGVKAHAVGAVTFVYGITGSTITETTDAGNHMVVAAFADQLTTVLFGTYDAGTLAFTGVMADGDIITIDDGIHDPVSFDFVTSPVFYFPNQVAVGATATDSAQNLKAVINSEVQLGNLALSVSGSGATLTVTNIATNSGFNVLAGDGATMTEDVDSLSHLTVTDFTGGVAGVATGASAAESATNVFQALNDASHNWGAKLAPAFTANLFVAFELNATKVGFINYNGALGSTDGALAEVADTGSVMTDTDFASPTAGLKFWAYAAPISGK